MTRRDRVLVFGVGVLLAAGGYVLAVPVSPRVRARMEANEKAAIEDIRTVLAAQVAYSDANAGFYEARLECLVAPADPQCIPSYPTDGPAFLDSALASLTLRAGYHRRFEAGEVPSPFPPTASPTSVMAYRYDATPQHRGFSGVRGFAGASDDRICFTPDGRPVPAGQEPGTLPPDCNELR